MFKHCLDANLCIYYLLNSFMLVVLITIYPLLCKRNQWTGFYMIGTFVVKKLWSKSTKKILEYSIKIQNNWKTKTFIFRSKFNLHSYKIFDVNKLY